MNEDLRKAIKAVVTELLQLDPDELKRRLEKHKNGDITKILIETGAIELRKEEYRKYLKAKGAKKCTN